MIAGRPTLLSFATVTEMRCGRTADLVRVAAVGSPPAATASLYRVDAGRRCLRSTEETRTANLIDALEEFSAWLEENDIDEPSEAAVLFDIASDLTNAVSDLLEARQLARGEADSPTDRSVQDQAIRELTLVHELVLADLPDEDESAVDLDPAVAAEWIVSRTGLDPEVVTAVLDLEYEFMVGVGIVDDPDREFLYYDTFPSIRYTARSPLDPLGTLGPEATMVEGGGSVLEGNRWGDYTSLSVDPVDDCAPVGLSLTKAASPAAVAPGGTIDYTIDYANASGAASEVVLTETVPPGTTFAGGSGWTGCEVGAPAGSVSSFDVGGLAPGQGGTVAFSVRVDTGVRSGVVDNEAVLSAGYGGGTVRATTTTPIAASARPVPVGAAPRFTG